MPRFTNEVQHFGVIGSTVHTISFGGYTISVDGSHCYTIVYDLTNFVDGSEIIPHNFALSQNYPNPFNPTTTISFSLAERTDATLTIYNLSGQTVKQFSDRYDAGSTAIGWDASGAASGLYFYKLVAGVFTKTKKILLLK